MIRPFKEEEIKFLKSKNLKYKINNDDVAYLDLYLGEILEKEEFNNEKPNDDILDIIYTILYNIDETPKEYRTRNTII